MSRVGNGLALLIITLALGLLWPEGVSPQLSARAGEVAVSVDTVQSFVAASPRVQFPVASLLFVVVFVGVGLFSWLTGSDRKGIRSGRVLLFGFYWVLLGVVMRALGGPLLTGDSSVYLLKSIAPWQAFGEHHPPGTMWVLWAGRHLGIPIGATMTAIGAFEAAIVQALFRVFCGWTVSSAIALALLFYPDFLTIRMSLWSEPIMLLGIVLCAAIMNSYRPRSWGGLAILLVLFIGLCEVRHASIFFLPAFILGVAFIDERRGVRRFSMVVVGSGLLFLACWMGINIMRTGRPMAVSSGSFECVHYIAAYHRIPFCSTAPTIPLCVVDSENVSLQQGKGANLDFGALDSFMFNPQSPLQKLKLTPEGACNLWGSMRKDIIAHHRVEALKLLGVRVLSQFWRWEMSERGAPVVTPLYRGTAEILDEIAGKVNKEAWALLLLWGGAVIIGIRYRRLLSPAVIFLVVGACGHIFGIALNNPFLAMRYLAVPKYMLSLAAFIILFSGLRGVAIGGDTSKQD